MALPVRPEAPAFSPRRPAGLVGLQIRRGGGLWESESAIGVVGIAVCQVAHQKHHLNRSRDSITAVTSRHGMQGWAD